MVPTSASTEENKVMAKPTITGTKNDVSVAGQTLTIVLGENGELTVAYVYDKYDLTGTDSVSNSTYNVENVNGKYQAGADVTLKLTQKTGADLATDAQVTVTINDGAIKATAQVTKAGQTAASAQWDGPKTYASAQEPVSYTHLLHRIHPIYLQHGCPLQIHSTRNTLPFEVQPIWVLIDDSSSSVYIELLDHY